MDTLKYIDETLAMLNQIHDEACASRDHAQKTMKLISEARQNLIETSSRLLQSAILVRDTLSNNCAGNKPADA